MKTKTHFLWFILLLALSVSVSGCDLLAPASVEPVDLQPSPTDMLPTDVPAATPTEIPLETPTEIPTLMPSPTAIPFEEKIIYIGPEQIECVGEGPQLCYQYKENPADEWSLFYDQIEGFKWQEGFNYELRVAVFPVANPPADGSSLRYELLEIISQRYADSQNLPVYIAITSPLEGQMLDPNQPILIKGMGAALFEGNVVVQIEDLDGNILALSPTIIDSPEAGTGGEGPWSIELSIEGAAVAEGKIFAFSTSPADGSIIASDSVSVVFGQPGSSATSLAATPWLLTDFADPALKSALAVHTVSITFYSAENRIAGKAACNNYFADYVSDGNRLILGTVASTMMMCPEVQMALEAAFLAALPEVTSYQIEGDQLTLMNASGEMLLRFQVDPFAAGTNFVRPELANATYQSEFTADGQVTLNRGSYSAPLAEGSAANLTVMLANFAAFGDLNGDGSEEAVVILVTDPGGSGTFYDLAVVEKQGDQLVNTAITPLGDRVIIHSLSIESGAIMVDMVTAGPNDPLCCPNTPVTARYILQGGELIPAN